MCHYVAQIYQDVLDSTSVRSQCQNNAKQGLKELPLTSSAGGPEEIFVGVSCCQRPEGLGSLWDAHRRATLAALSTGLQGLHGELRDAGNLVVEGSKLTVTVNSSVESFETDRLPDNKISINPCNTFPQWAFLETSPSGKAGGGGGGGGIHPCHQAYNHSTR